MADERKRAVEIVEALLAGGYETEEEDEERLQELKSLVPDPEVERFIFWGPEGPEEARFDSMSAEEIVDEAMSYQPIQL